MSGDLLGLTLHAQEINDEQLIGEHAAAMRPWPRTRQQALALDVYSRELGQRNRPETRTELVGRRRRESRDRLFPDLRPRLTIVQDDPDDPAVA